MLLQRTVNYRNVPVDTIISSYIILTLKIQRVKTKIRIQLIITTKIRIQLIITTKIKIWLIITTKIRIQLIIITKTQTQRKNLISNFFLAQLYKARKDNLNSILAHIMEADFLLTLEYFLLVLLKELFRTALIKLPNQGLILGFKFSLY